METRKYRDKYSKVWREEIVLTPAEQKSWYNECLNRVLTNTREVLDNLEYCEEFHVGWNNYGKREMKHKCIKCGKEYILSRKQPCECGNTRFKLVHYGVGMLKQNLPQKRDFEYK